MKYDFPLSLEAVINKFAQMHAIHITGREKVNNPSTMVCDVVKLLQTPLVHRP
jgi:hypothetical protein